MENNTFDRIVRNLCTDASRRQILGGLLASTAALAGGIGLGTTPAHAARKRRRTGGGAASDLVAVCHISNGRPPKRIRVRRRALREHLAHGDTRFVDCCVNDDCEVPECFTAQCVSGTCSQTQLPQGALCTFGGSAAVGNCTADAQCLPTGSGGG